MTYEELVELARTDEAILGLVLTGSRATGLGVTDDSDWDVRLIVRDEAHEECRSRFGTPHGSKVEVVVLSETELELAGRARHELVLGQVQLGSRTRCGRQRRSCRGRREEARAPGG